MINEIMQELSRARGKVISLAQNDTDLTETGENWVWVAAAYIETAERILDRTYGLNSHIESTATERYK